LLSLQITVFGLFADARHNDTLAVEDQVILLVMVRSVRVLFYLIVRSPTFEALRRNQQYGWL